MRRVSTGLMALLISAHLMAAPPRHSADLATCTRSATLLACNDAHGNSYSVATAGSTTRLKGYEVLDKRRWAQTNSRYGQLTFLPGWHLMARLG